MKKNPVSIPHTVWHADDIRRGEREAADALGLTLYELMLRAGEVAFQVCRSAYPDARHWLVLCGHGNNGGDGYVVARLAKAVSIEVTLLAQESDKPLPEGSNANDIPEKASIASTIHSVDVPVIYGYNIIKEGPYSLAIFGGPKIRFMLQKQSDITFENFDQTDIHETLRPLNLCATLGVAVTISRIFFDFRYDVGLHNMSKQIEYTVPPVEGMPGTVEPDKGIYFHRKDNVMSFSLGVFF